MYKMQAVKGRREFSWHPHPILKEGKESTLEILDNYPQREKAKRLGLSFRGYYKLLGDFLESAGMRQEAWICEMFRQKNFDRLFSKRRAPESDEGLSEVERAWDSLGHILLFADILELSREYLKPAVVSKQKSKLSSAEIAFAKMRFGELTQNKSADYAYDYIARGFSKNGRKVSKSTVRRACDKTFAKQSDCTYGKKSKRIGLAFLDMALKQIRKKRV